MNLYVVLYFRLAVIIRNDISDIIDISYCNNFKLIKEN